MLRKPFAVSVFLIMTVCAASGQVIMPGSTYEGDYLRGVGIMAASMGVYKADTAVADAIHTTTAIRWNEYLSAVAEYPSRTYAERHAQIRVARNQNYNARVGRIGRSTIKKLTDNHGGCADFIRPSPRCRGRFKVSSAERDRHQRADREIPPTRRT